MSTHKSRWIPHQRPKHQLAYDAAGTNKSSFSIQFGHFLKVDPDTLAVEQNKVNVLQGGAGGRHKMVGDGLQGELGSQLLWESVSLEDNKDFMMSNKLFFSGSYETLSTEFSEAGNTQKQSSCVTKEISPKTGGGWSKWQRTRVTFMNGHVQKWTPHSSRYVYVYLEDTGARTWEPFLY